MPHGYPLSIFRGKYDVSFKCIECQWILRLPVQLTPCGHRFCNDCWQHRIRAGSAPGCPECPDNEDEQIEAHTDNGIVRDMNTMTAHCSSPDCGWSGRFKDFQIHYASCERQATEREGTEHQQQAAEQDVTGLTSIRHNELQLIDALLTMFYAMTLFHVLCYINYEIRSRVNDGLNRLAEATQLQHDTLESQSGRIRALEEAGYDGKLTWKIVDISSRIKDALAGRVQVLLSPDIYTNKQGRESYRMIAVLHPNGVPGHLSLYVEVIEGTMDAIMKWPFKAKVTVKFLDQTGQIRIDETFRASFNRPGVSGSGCRHGFTEFLSQTSLLTNDVARRSPTDEDAVFIEIKIEIEGESVGNECKRP